MSDGTVLSQREIDALLSGGGGAPAPAAPLDRQEEAAPRARPVAAYGKAIRTYDFRRPDKFSKEQLRSLQAVHEKFAHTLGSALSNQMRTNVELKVSSIEQGLYGEYVEQVPPPTFAQVVRMSPLEGSVLMAFGQDLGLAMVDRLLGGNGTLLDGAHEVTDIDLQLLRGVGGLMAEALGEAWEHLAPVQPTVMDLYQDAQPVHLAPPSEVVVAVFLEVAALHMVAGLSIATPYSLLESVMPRLSAEMFVGTSTRMGATVESRAHLRTQMERTPATVRVELGSTQVRAADLSRLQAGDVIRLDGLASRAVPVRVGRRRKWYGVPGLVGQRIAVQLERWEAEEMPAQPGKGGARGSGPEAQNASDERRGAPPQLRTLDGPPGKESSHAA